MVALAVAMLVVGGLQVSAGGSEDVPTAVAGAGLARGAPTGWTPSGSVPSPAPRQIVTRRSQRAVVVDLPAALGRVVHVRGVARRGGLPATLTEICLVPAGDGGDGLQRSADWDLTDAQGQYDVRLRPGDYILCAEGSVDRRLVSIDVPLVGSADGVSQDIDLSAGRQ